MKKNFTTVVLVVLIVCAAMAAYLYFSTKNAVDSAIKTMSPFATVKYKRFSNPMDGSISIHDVSISDNMGLSDSSPVDLGSIELRLDSVFDYINFEKKINSGEILPKLQLRINHLYIGLDSLDSNESNEFDLISSYMTALGCGDIKEIGDDYLADLGYAGVDSSINVNFEYNKLSSEVNMNLDLIMHGMGSYSARTSIPNIYSAADMANVDGKLNNLVIGVQDLGYNQNLTEFCAQHTGVEPNIYIDQHIEELRAYLTKSGVRLNDDVFDAYRAYITGDGVITLSSQPASAVNLKDIALYKVKDWSNVLGLTMQINDKPPKELLFDWNEATVVSDLMNARSISTVVKTEKGEARAPQTRSKQVLRGKRTYSEIPPAELYGHINAHVKIETKLGRSYKGVIKEVTRNQVVVSIRLKGGKAEIPLGTNKIAKAYLANY